MRFRESGRPRGEPRFRFGVRAMTMPCVPSASGGLRSMPGKSSQPTAPRIRLDAVALALFVAGAIFVAAVVSYRPLTGLSNWLGETGDQVAALLVDPLGWA